MKHYIVEIIWNDPYPKKFSYRSLASTIALGIYRGVKEFRKEQKGRKIKELNIRVYQYGTQETI